MISDRPNRKGPFIAAVAIVLGGVLLMAVHSFAGSDGGPEGVFSDVGFGAPFVGIGGLALIGLNFDKPVLCRFAGLFLIPMSVVSIVLVPLLIPAAILMFAPVESLGRKGLVVAPAMFAAVPLITFVILVFHQDPATWTTPDGFSAGSSNIVTSLEASISVIGVLLTLAGALMWAMRNVPARSRMEQTV